MTRLEAFLAMLQRGQDSAMLRFSIGGEYLSQGDSANAVAHLRVATTLDEKYSAAWKMLGKALSESGDTAAAIRAYETGISVATAQGDRQAAKEMAVFRKRLLKSIADDPSVAAGN